MSCMRCHHAHIPSHSPTPSHMPMLSVTTQSLVVPMTHICRILTGSLEPTTSANGQLISSQPRLLITQLEVYVLIVCLIVGHITFRLTPQVSYTHRRTFRIIPQVSYTHLITFRIIPRVSYTHIPRRLTAPFFLLPTHITFHLN